MEKTVKKVTDEDVANRLKAMQDRNARQIDVADRASQNGDTLVFDFEGSVDGVPFDGGKAEKYSLELGSGQFIPGFEPQLENRNIGDEFDVNVTFPEDYHAEELKGKEAVFKCKVHEIKAKEVPALDDEFAKDVSEFDTLDELRADIRKKMEEQNEKEASTEVENKLIDKVIENMEAEIPVSYTHLDVYKRQHACRRCRFDVAEVELAGGKAPRITALRYYPNAFTADEEE